MRQIIGALVATCLAAAPHLLLADPVTAPSSVPGTTSSATPTPPPAATAPTAADPPAAAPAVPTWANTLAAWGITANGYIAASYYASNSYPSNIHQFDTEHNTFQLDEAGLQVAYQPQKGFGGLVDVITGEDAKILDIAEGGSGNYIDVRQAFLQYASGPMTIIAGKFLTLAGAEVINPTQDTNFSRSLLFFDAEPLDHTGVRATFAVTTTFSFILGVNNGWNVTSTSYGSKTGEAGIAWTPNKTFSLATQGYFGKPPPETTGGVELGEKSLIDVVATYNATSTLTFIANFDWDQQEIPGAPTATWDGIALYANYQFNPRWRVSVRGEYLDDKDGYLTGPIDGQHLSEGTVTFGYAPTSHFELRLEGRYDSAQTKIFYRTDPSSAYLPNLPLMADSLSEVALQGVYKF
ncbi:MAG: outer membrane beta-barrel protein [Steroidobacteraceae bacterium]